MRGTYPGKYITHFSGKKIQTPVDVLALDTNRWEEKRKEKGLIFHEIDERGMAGSCLNCNICLHMG